MCNRKIVGKKQTHFVFRKASKEMYTKQVRNQTETINEHQEDPAPKYFFFAKGYILQNAICTLPNHLCVEWGPL